MNAKSTQWVGGTVVLSVLIAALAWFLAISPTLTAAAAARTEAGAAEDRNVQLQAQLDRLVEQAAGLDATKAELAGIGRQIPSEAQLAEYVRALQSTAEETGVTVVTLDAALPETIAPAALPEQVAPSEGEAGEATEPPAAEGTEGTTGASVAVGPVEGFAGVSLTITAVGPVSNVFAFIERVQTGNERLFLVTKYTAKGLQAAEAANGRPAVGQGDVELVLTGFVYVLSATAGASSGAEPTESPELAPLPAGKEPRIAVESSEGVVS
ncbi:hypothetical protein [Cellulomonas sp. KH9]|uniref:hypothetical protein n=1 Tax=Cellulomonas sp. KH9 TaxID=1855324 RepID=UPI0008E0AAAC|nr:hypothetical protein [Cellulomonas sp. KH9]SFJ96886.1 hypothetical protein SAMN05216467_1461 [Cellulomonas sp. KH9]